MWKHQKINVYRLKTQHNWNIRQHWCRTICGYWWCTGASAPSSPRCHNYLHQHDHHHHCFHIIFSSTSSSSKVSSSWWWPGASTPSPPRCHNPRARHTLQMGRKEKGWHFYRLHHHHHIVICSYFDHHDHHTLQMGRQEKVDFLRVFFFSATFPYLNIIIKNHYISIIRFPTQDRTQGGIQWRRSP